MERPPNEPHTGSLWGRERWTDKERGDFERDYRFAREFDTPPKTYLYVRRATEQSRTSLR